MNRIVTKQYTNSANPIKYLTSKLATASPTTPIDGIIPQPNTKIIFNVYTFFVRGVEPSIPIDIVDFTPHSAEFSKFTFSFTKGKEYRFLGFGGDITQMVRPEFFTDILEDRSYFDGLSGEYTLYYETAKKRMYIEDASATYPNLILFCGVGVGFPHPPYGAHTQWGFGVPKDCMYLKKVGEGVFEAVIYMAADFDFKMFVARGWVWQNNTPPPVADGIFYDSRWLAAPYASELQAQDFTIGPRELLQAHGWNGDLNQGSSFVPGVYKITVNINSTVRSITLEEYKTEN